MSQSIIISNEDVMLYSSCSAIYGEIFYTYYTNIGQMASYWFSTMECASGIFNLKILLNAEIGWRGLLLTPI
jgi:hypothetical protein